MTELSPAAQTVLDAYRNPHIYKNVYSLAVALEAAADQVMPNLEEPDWGACNRMLCDIELYTDHMRKRSQLLAIAAELKAHG